MLSNFQVISITTPLNFKKLEIGLEINRDINMVNYGKRFREDPLGNCR